MQVNELFSFHRERFNSFIYGYATIYYSVRETQNLKFIFLEKPDGKDAISLSLHVHSFKNHRMGNINDRLMFVLNYSKQTFWNWYSITVELLKEKEKFSEERLTTKEITDRIFPCKNPNRMEIFTINAVIYCCILCISCRSIMVIRFLPGENIRLLSIP
jgi:hypothetical protein